MHFHKLGNRRLLISDRYVHSWNTQVVPLPGLSPAVIVVAVSPFLAVQPHLLPSVFAPLFSFPHSWLSRLLAVFPYHAFVVALPRV
jgi:hypothetical protein